MSKPFYAIFWLFIVALASGSWSGARAHGAMQRQRNACLLKVGPDFMYFSGYQPAASRNRFCEDIPATGDTIFVLDYGQDEMRGMSTDFRIIRDIGEQAEQERLDSVTVAYLPPKVYPAGTLNFEHVFKEPGAFVGIVTVDGPNGEHWVSRFPFTVGGRPLSARMPYFLIAAAGVLALTLFVWGKEEQKPRRV
ncbi:MAG: hypothetical protein FJX45_16090 [Alphaproteobacteria bacterium]|nr:hypothetical protein [Alphaproteobacteria bacterium]MBM3653364.1 hypothetical protein [Alphaproteobacteria bacterium]